MSSFSATFQFFPGDEQGQSRWLLDHYVEHTQFSDKLLESTITTSILPIQQMGNTRDWLNAHQRMSQSVWTGIGGGQMIDLERVDWSNPGMLQDWLERHARWHNEVRISLGL